jgi:hypothetical protein
MGRLRDMMRFGADESGMNLLEMMEQQSAQSEEVYLQLFGYVSCHAGRLHQLLAYALYFDILRWAVIIFITVIIAFIIVIAFCRPHNPKR